MAFFTVTGNVTPGNAANILFELAFVSGHPGELVEFEISQAGTTTSAQFEFGLGISTGAASTWTTSTLTAKDVDDAVNATANTTVKLYSSGTSADGTGATIRRRSGLNVLGCPFLWIPSMEVRLKVASGHFLYGKFLVAPPASTAFDFYAAFREN